MPSLVPNRFVARSLLFVLSLAAHAGAQVTVSNGGFEDPAIPPDDLDGGLLVVAPAILPGGWDVTAGSVDVLRRSGAVQFQTPEGSQAVDLTGMGTRGTIRRTLDATGDALFRLSFWIAGNPTCEQGIKRVNFLVENTVFAQLMFNTTGRSPTNMGWSYHEYTFAGLPAPRFLQFQSTTGTNCGLMVDDVRLEECLDVTAEPMSQTRCAGSPALFSVTAEGVAPQYRWRKGTVALTNDANISGVATPTLVLASVSASDAGDYSCQVFNDCGELSSASATLSVAPSPCLGNTNGDQTVDFADITKVLEFWGANYAPGTGPGDSDCDGMVDFVEITLVLSQWANPCP